VDELRMEYEPGDVVTSFKTSSPIYKRDCTIVHADKSMVGMITDGLEFVHYMRTNDLTLKMVKKGEGYMEKETKDKLTAIMKKWPFAEFIKRLPDIIDKHRRTMDINPQDKVWIKMDGYVPRGLVDTWKEFSASVDLMKTTTPELPPYIQTLMFEWVMMGAVISLKMAKTMMEDEEIK